MEITFKNGKFKPPCSNYYLVAENGIFICKENQCITASVMVDERLGLEEHSEGVKWKLPKIPCRLVHRAIAFFRHVRELYQSESLLWIYYSPTEEEYDLYAPVQKVSDVSVSTEDKTPTPDGWLRIGTMHSHPCDAFHSSGDDNDEFYFDGLHIVCGNLQKIIPDFSCSVVVSGRRFIQPTDQILDVDTEIPSEFINNVKKWR